MSSKTKTGKRVKAVRHDEETRLNNPTAEMQHLVSDEEASPVQVEYARSNSSKKNPEKYARNANFDPQLVWRGKEQEDKTRLEVEAPPIYKQETIAPEAIVKDLQRQMATTSQAGESAHLFDDYAVWQEKEARIEFYSHQQKWANRMILGDSLHVMASLAYKESLRGKVQCIFMDPPYGINFKSNWQTSTKSATTKDKDKTHEPELIRAFRDTWHDGIHSYLSYLRDRLTVARDLLTESGSVFVQIGDKNVHLVRSLLDEIFSPTNFIAEIVLRTRSTSTRKHMSVVNDFILWYAKNEEHVKTRNLYQAKGKGGFAYADDGEKEERHYSSDNLASTSGSDNTRLPFVFQGKEYTPKSGRGWRCKMEGLHRLAKAGRVIRSGKKVRYKHYHDDFSLSVVNNFWDQQINEQNKVYVVQTGKKAIQRCLLMATDPGDLVLDPTCGSGTTAAVAEEWGRRWITIDTSRVALTIARARLMGAKYDYYLLNDSAEGAREEANLSKNPVSQSKFRNDIRQGFVYARKSHITLKSIANNAEIDEVWEEWQAKIAPLLAELNAAVGESWKEWEVPSQAEKGWKPAAQKSHKDFFQAKNKRQAAMDASIAKNAEMEYLVDQPCKASNIVRVSGPFTFESWSPHRVVQPEAAAGKQSQEGKEEARLWKAIYDNLKRSGISTGRKDERLRLEDLRQFESGGESRILFEGEYQEKGKDKRAAVCVGPEFGAVTSKLLVDCIREAAVMFDTLIMLGFAFEPNANEKLITTGKLRVICARIGNDLHMASLLKEEKDANLFASIGEPDIACKQTKDGQWRATLCGIDIYNPVTGEVRSADSKDIACWFIDTNYDENQFFVRHAYFTGGGKDPYKQLKTALKSEINEEIWASLYSDTSRPFPAPETGKIAVKAINHYGDEVLKVIAIPPQK